MTVKYSLSTLLALVSAAALAACDSDYAAQYKYPTTPAQEVPAGTLAKAKKKAEAPKAETPKAPAKTPAAAAAEAPPKAETAPEPEKTAAAAAPEAAEPVAAAEAPSAEAEESAPAASEAETAPEEETAKAADEAAAAAPSGGIDPAVMKKGEQSFALCMACHQANGMGLAGAFPPLVASEWVLGDPARPIAIVINGLMGEIEVKGKKYNNVMAGLGGALKDDQIAAVLTYVRNSWGNSAPAVDVELVKTIRAELAGTSMWNGGAAVTAFAEGRK